MNTVKYFVLVVSILASTDSMAANQWYNGPVSTVLTSGPDGSFYAYVDNADIISTCAYKRVLFRVEDMGVERTKAALALAMASIMTGKNWGVVLDMPPVGQVCYASATSTQGAALYR